jgi:hypothetical protein
MMLQFVDGFIINNTTDNNIPRRYFDLCLGIDSEG